ncbi:hypothetical protein [Streptomyces sp. GbtcB6]|nr:hypothetical protein [Streptomyces sp. GbtcB6]
MHDCFDGFWSAGLDDLTDTGRAAVDALSGIYGRPPVLLTLHDT